MDLKGLLSKKIEIGSPKAGHYPTKRTINFLDRGDSEVRRRNMIIAAAVIVLILVLFMKFLVFDQLTRLSDAQAQYNSRKVTLEKLKASNSGYSKAEGRYSRYSFGYMTNEELSLHDREDMIGTINSVLGGSSSIRAVSIVADSSNGNGSSEVTGANVAQVRIECGSMRTVSHLVSRLNSRSNVVRASALQVDKGTEYDAGRGRSYSSGTVTADLTITFTSPLGDDDSKKDSGESVSGQLKDQTDRFNKAEQGAD